MRFVSGLALFLFLANLALADEIARVSRSFRLENEGDRISYCPAVAYSADGAWFLAGLSTGEILEFDATTRELRSRLAASKGPVLALALTGDGKSLVACATRTGLVLQDVGSDRPRASRKGVETRYLAIRPGDGEVATARSCAIDIRPLPSLQATVAFAFPGQVTGLAWSPDGRYLAGVDNLGNLRVWERDKKKLVRYEEFPLALYAVSFHPDGTRVAVGGMDKKVCEVEIASKGSRILSASQPYFVTALGYDPSGERLAVGDESCDVWLLSASTGDILYHGKHHHECWLSQVAWTPDGTEMAFGCRPNTLASRPAVHRPNLAAEAQFSPRVEGEHARVMTVREEIVVRLGQDDLREAMQAAVGRLRALRLARPANQGGNGGGKGENDDDGTRDLLLQVLSSGDPENLRPELPALVQDPAPSREDDPSETVVEFPDEHRTTTVPAAPAVRREDLAALDRDIRAFPELAPLLAREQEVVADRERAIETGVEELSGQWCINTWNVQR
ncbi:MAG: PD40 domain-containing protein [Planctomycetes bacterium]|nr:PD40 domain-containing protein [Planctomycetota bacterium]